MTTDVGAPAQAPPRAPKRSTVGERIRFAFEVLGELLITFGVIVLLFAVYELKVTDIRAAATQRGLQSQLQHTWAGTAPSRPNGPDPVVHPVKGQPFAEIRIARLGAGYSKVVVEGVDHDDLKKGPGHYPKTALPGQIGNTVISGHRTTYGAPFSNLDKLRPGDVVDIQVQYRTYHYHVTSTRIVSPNQRSVLLPVPDQPGVVPTDRILTMTTCNPKFSAAQRMVVFAEMKPGDFTDTVGGAGH